MPEMNDWDWEIDAGRRWFRWELGDLGRYRDLLLRLVRRDLLANYQQTMLGAFWILLQPILTTLVYWVIFGRIVKVPTGSAPPLLFYLSGIIVWNFFSDCLNGTMYTFLTNAQMFNKVYFPRLIVPLSGVLAHGVRLGVQLVLFFGIYVYYAFSGAVPAPGLDWFLLPVFFLLTGLFGLGMGLAVSVLTARYRDLDYTLQFVLRLWMFASPVVYPAGLVHGALRPWFWLNPLTPLIEGFRAVCFGGAVDYTYLGVCAFVVILILVGGVSLFKRQERRLTDFI
ncbi:MAG TPA: ABC transporter permease [Dinghuibacter sp.]|jgi:lipopolysaccharide transport system permease protein|uniref:ABC transporter permease n=1 Tax=Dinghuibacter sp. TaxID=2024697 RepID=UPI002B8B2287|nr:ABC transporter permease [Dinghuibacter sp.]HTJ14906.1 ABC transporter permease [Dinghuibacter sp.]